MYFTLTETITNKFDEIVWEHQTEFEGDRANYEKMASLWRMIANYADDGNEYHLTENIGKEQCCLTLTFVDWQDYTIKKTFCCEVL